jgi:hypothetical protein
MRPLMAARKSRLRRIRPIEVFEQANFGHPDRPEFGTAGSIQLLLARSEKLLKEARATLETGHLGLENLVTEMSQQIAARECRSLEPMIDASSEEPSIVGLSYDGFPMADPLFLPKSLALTLLHIPYRGGHLPRDGFGLVEYVRKPESAGLYALVINISPKRTRAEIAALAQVPADMPHLHGGNIHKCSYVEAAVGAFAGAIAAGLATGAAGAIAGAIVGAAAGEAGARVVDAVGREGPDRAEKAINLQLNDLEMEKTRSALSFKELVHLRREAMQRASRRECRQDKR